MSKLQFIDGSRYYWRRQKHPSTSTLEITDTHARAGKAIAMGDCTGIGNIIGAAADAWEAVWNLA